MALVIDYGSAVRMFRSDGTLDPDLDGPMITGPRVALEGVGVLLMTKAGSVPWSSFSGVARPLPSLINSTPSDPELRRIEADYAAAAPAQVGNVVSARFAFQRTAAGLRLAGLITTSTGVVSPLVAAVGDVIKILFPLHGAPGGSGTAASLTTTVQSNTVLQ